MVNGTGKNAMEIQHDRFGEAILPRPPLFYLDKMMNWQSAIGDRRNEPPGV
jgi:hypothetical protein